MCTQVGPTWVGLWAPHALELFEPQGTRLGPPLTLVHAMRDVLIPQCHPKIENEYLELTWKLFVD